MLINCNNKGCMQQSNALLSSNGKDVVCQECGKDISGISTAMKRTLKSFGQVIRTEQRQAFMLACRACHANRQVVLDQNNKTICKQCHGPMTVHPAFRLAMENAGSKLEKVDTSEKVEEKKTPPKKGTVRRTKKTETAPEVDGTAVVVASKPKATKKTTRRKKTTKKAE